MSTGPWDDLEYLPDNFLDGKPFRHYKQAVSKAIAEAGEPVTIRRIHEMLGDAAKPDWTADALEMAKDIEAIGILPTRYVAKPKARS